ncbi:hypothetical protein Forpe1208_v017026 [Fusarium oxysporum f. sp. rapae]|uniref:Uncharacterized protein n=1 Tax=Fusarium oxysporum f. sp. rapae TaxID=485398 RepID=A0A8J5TNX4_FUSOX|nr:hypothetical protein Forpe1208_v017026 [Fusarium oxysporum f. sp. rapae]
MTSTATVAQLIGPPPPIARRNITFPTPINFRRLSDERRRDINNNNDDFKSLRKAIREGSIEDVVLADLVNFGYDA